MERKRKYKCDACHRVFWDYPVMIIHQYPCRCPISKPVLLDLPPWVSSVWSITWPLLLMILLCFFHREIGFSAQSKIEYVPNPVRPTDAGGYFSPLVSANFLHTF